MTCVPPCAPNTPESGNVRPPAPAGASVEITGPLEVNIAGAGESSVDPLFVQVTNPGGLTIFPINELTEDSFPEPILTDGSNYYRATSAGLVPVVGILNHGPRVVFSTDKLGVGQLLQTNTDHTVTLQNTGASTISYGIAFGGIGLNLHTLQPGQSASYSGEAVLHTFQPPGYTGLIVTVFGTRPVVLL